MMIVKINRLSLFSMYSILFRIRKITYPSKIIFYKKIQFFNLSHLYSSKILILLLNNSLLGEVAILLSIYSLYWLPVLRSHVNYSVMNSIFIKNFGVLESVSSLAP